jgi:hypothetical protein
MSEAETPSQVRFMQELLKTMEMALNDKDIKGLNGLFEHGASMTRRFIDGNEGPLDPIWK